MKKKVLALVLAMVLLVVGVAAGTLAWLTSKSDTVTNTFTTSDIKVELEETKNDFKMVPGFTIDKDPKVTVKAGSEDCYLFVKLEKSSNFDSFLTYVTAENWTLLTGVDGVYYRVVRASNADQSFGILKDNKVTVLSTVTKEMMNGLTQDTYPTLTVSAYASQLYKSAGEEFTEAEAWANVQS